LGMWARDRIQQCAHCSAPAAAVLSIVGLNVDTAAVAGDRSRRAAGVHVVAGAQELGGGGEVCGGLDLGDGARDFLDDADPDCGGVRSGVEEERQDIGEGIDGEARAEIDQRGRAGAGVVDDLPVGIRAAMEADADGVNAGSKLAHLAGVILAHLSDEQAGSRGVVA
jgi:hypothetical protein